MKSTEAITYASIAVIAISLFFIGTELTGLATGNDTAIVNVTILTAAEINFTTDILDFGSGAVTPGQTAILDSEGTNTSWSGNATYGNLTLENIGSVNLTLQLKTDLSPADFLGGAAPTFQAKVVNNTGNVGACTGTNVFTNYANINTTMQSACGTFFGYEAAIDEIAIDFSMNISDDAEGVKVMTITAIGTY
ncbi:hypothetical protein HN903_00015 [archaeon]|jgi:hypothetical protein|nr:hypothetical protein [archaeon]MBT6956310.1 hypothetical protein [archaeon]MBT7128121.1 hypothetical protein [archaeon]